MKLPIQKEWATAYATKDFISVNTCSGFRRSARDPDGVILYFSLSVSDEELGAAIRSALSASKFISPDEARLFFNLNSIEQNYEGWVSDMVARFGYNSRRDAFKDMKLCMIERVRENITIKPTNHEKLEAWGGKGIDSSDYETFDVTASEVNLGTALKRCFSKCIG